MGSDFRSLLFKGIQIEKFEVVDRSPCLADPERFKVVARTGKTLEEILPVLFLALPNARYSESSRTMSYSFDRHNVVVGYNGEVAVTFIKDDEELKILSAKITDTINRALAFHASHPRVQAALLEEKKKLSPITINSALPRTNCKECGESGCFTFASRLYMGEKNMADCPHLDATKMRRLLQPISI